MITDDLVSTDSFKEGRLRIFTRAAVGDVDPYLRTFVLGYDERLDGPKSPLPGTKADFAQRALHHFHFCNSVHVAFWIRGKSTSTASKMRRCTGPYLSGGLLSENPT